METTEFPSPTLGPSDPICAKINGGELAIRSEFKFQVALRHDGTTICGGVILNSLIILTAAHCLISHEREKFRVIAGEYDQCVNEGTEQVKLVSKIYVHPEYDACTHVNDIGIVVLDSPLNFTTHVGEIDYPGHFNQTFLGNGTVIGWGRNASIGIGIGSRKLHKVVLPLITDAECQSYYQTTPILNSMMCAGGLEKGKDACRGDSGGGLICTMPGSTTRVLCGIVSMGYPCDSFKTSSPGVYTEVSHFNDWIEQVARNVLNCSSAVNKNTRLCGRGGESSMTCDSGQFRCNNGDCLDSSLQCDGEDDCDDGEDEQNCVVTTLLISTNNTRRCNEGMTACLGLHCVDEAWVCNGHIRFCSGGYEDWRMYYRRACRRRLQSLQSQNQ